MTNPIAISKKLETLIFNHMPHSTSMGSLPGVPTYKSEHYFLRDVLLTRTISQIGLMNLPFKLFENCSAEDIELVQSYTIDELITIVAGHYTVELSPKEQLIQKFNKCIGENDYEFELQAYGIQLTVQTLGLDIPEITNHKIWEDTKNEKA